MLWVFSVLANRCLFLIIISSMFALIAIDASTNTLFALNRYRKIKCEVLTSCSSPLLGITKCLSRALFSLQRSIHQLLNGDRNRVYFTSLQPNSLLTRSKVNCLYPETFMRQIISCKNSSDFVVVCFA